MHYLRLRNHALLSGLRKQQQSLRLLLFAVVACIGYCATSFTCAEAADESTPAPNTVAAECQVQIIKNSRQPGTVGNIFIQVPSLSAIMNDNYRRGMNGDWEIPTVVEANDPSLKFLLQTPRGPLVVELDVLVDGRGFRETREEWIDESLAGDESSDTTDEATAAKTGSTSDELENSADAEEVSNAEADNDSDDPPTAIALPFRPTDAVNRLKSYASQAEDVDREEARWLLAQWMPGPVVLELRPGFAGGRSRMAPMWTALDTDADGQLSPNEIASSSDRLRTLDRNEDDWIDEAELSRGQSPAVTTWHSFPLLTVINDTIDTPRLLRQLQAVQNGAAMEGNSPTRLTTLLTKIGCSSVSMIDAARLSKLKAATPQLSIRAEFATKQTNPTALSVTATADEIQTDGKRVTAVKQAIGVSLPDCEIEVAAAQLPAERAQSTWNGQISVGAVIDGYPLLRQFDGDNDRRLALREIETVTADLHAFDRDANGSVELDELPVPIRLTVTLGANVHTVLKKATSAVRQRRPEMSDPAPDWFVGMDGNKDGDLTVSEFLGTREQFDKLDVNGNQRISGVEAMAQDNATK